MMTEPKKYPLWKEALKHVIGCAKRNKEPFIPLEEMEEILEAKKDTPEFNFQIMALTTSLRREEGIVLFSCRGLGYKIANDVEKVKEGYRRTQKRIVSTLKTQREIGITVNVNSLDEETKELHELQQTKNGLLNTFNKRLTLDIIKPGMIVTEDRVRLVDILEHTRQVQGG